MDSGKYALKIAMCAMFTNFDTRDYLNMLIFISFGFGIQNLTQNSRFGRIWFNVSNIILFL